MSQAVTRHARRLRATTSVVLALATVALFVAGCASLRPRSASASGTAAVGGVAATRTAVTGRRAATTVQHVFAALDSNGAPAEGVVARRSGACFTSSITVSARTAYRCLAGNEILDPCFTVSSSAGTLSCYQSPWSKATELTLTAKLPAAAPLRIDHPWAIELANGQRCVTVAGTTSIARGVSLSYRCVSGTAGLRNVRSTSLLAIYRAATGTLDEFAVVASWTA